MEFRIEYAHGVQDDVQAIHDYIKEDSPQNATKWQQGIAANILTLQVMPSRCSIAPENLKINAEVRHTFFGKYRVIFTIRGGTVFILSVRHGRRLPLRKNEVVERLQ